MTLLHGQVGGSGDIMLSPLRSDGELIFLFFFVSPQSHKPDVLFCSPYS